jgi:2-haloacid dehalogenase
MSGAEVDAVVFDVGNVLLRWHPHNLYRRMGLSDAETAALLAETGLLAVNLECDGGLPFADGIARLVAAYPHRRSYLEAFDTRWTDLLDGAIEHNVAVLQELKAHGVPVFAITNFAREKFDVSRRLFPFLDAFDDIVVSGDVRCVKPDPAIYRLLIERQSLDTRRAVFIDDSRRNVDAAAALGFRVIHVENEEVSVREELRRLGLPV